MSYDPYAALEFFKAAGKPRAFAEGDKIFGESEKGIPVLRRNKMYLLVKGEVGLVAGRKSIAVIKPGEIFGELAVLAHAPRSASAVARAASTVMSLDEDQFQAALRKKPAFALMLMGILIRRLRETIAQIKLPGRKKSDAWKEAAAFDPEQLKQLVDGLSDERTAFYPAGKVILAEGQKGVRMYTVLEGRVAISIGGQVVERLGPGGVFGEAALVEGSTRLANAMAETDCELLPVTREAFLALVKLSPQFADTMLTSLSERLRFLTARLA
jgi:CRP/FNR family cyclic AMP-dependent transcriptional regulator